MEILFTPMLQVLKLFKLVVNMVNELDQLALHLYGMDKVRRVLRFRVQGCSRSVKPARASIYDAFFVARYAAVTR